MSSTSLFSFPFYLWNLYVEYLWNYQPGSWVERIASTFHVMALLVIAPFAILTMLDVASYVIARTLGVIDATKASTSGAAVVVNTHGARTTDDEDDGVALGVPSIHISLPSPAKDAFMTATETETEGEAETGVEGEGGFGARERGASSESFFRDNAVEEGNPRLAGVDAFSPAPSQPSSPTLSRHDLAGHGHHQIALAPLTVHEENEESETSLSSAGSSKFTMIDGESGSEEGGEGVLVRRRTRRVDGRDEDSS